MRFLTFYYSIVKFYDDMLSRLTFYRNKTISCLSIFRSLYFLCKTQVLEGTIFRCVRFCKKKRKENPTICVFYSHFICFRLDVILFISKHPGTVKVLSIILKSIYCQKLVNIVSSDGRAYNCANKYLRRLRHNMLVLFYCTESAVDINTSYHDCYFPY